VYYESLRFILFQEFIDDFTENFLETAIGKLPNLTFSDHNTTLFNGSDVL